MTTFTLETTVNHLRAALRVCVPISRNQRIPVLNMLHIKDGQLTSTDLDIATTVKIAATKATGEALVPFHELRALADNLPTDAAINLSIKNGELKLSHTRGEYQLPTLPASEFPQFAFKPSDAITDIPDKFIKALRYVISSTSYEETRYYLNGINLSKDNDGNSVAVATDGHRLTWHPVDFDLGKLEGIIIPNAVIKIINRLPTPASIEISDNGRIAFHYNGMSVFAKLIDGTYPNWQKIARLPADTEKQHLIIPRAEFRNALRRLRSMMRQNMPERSVYLAAHMGEMHLISHISGNYEYRETISLPDIAFTMDTVMSINGKYLHDMFAAIHADSLTLQIINNETPISIMGSNECRAILMPMRPDYTIVQKLLSSFQKEQVAA